MDGIILTFSATVRDSQKWQFSGEITEPKTSDFVRGFEYQWLTGELQKKY